MLKKLIKIIVACVVVLIVVIVIAGMVGYSSLNGLARSAIEKGSTYALGVNTTLDKASIGLFSGEFSLSGLDVTNPPDFVKDYPDFLKLGSGSVAVNYSTLMEDTIHLPLLKLDDLTMTLVQEGGKKNYEVILDNLKKFESTESKSSTPAPQPGGQTQQQPGKQLIIDDLVITNVNVTVNLLPVGGKISQLRVPIDKIELKDVGSKQSIKLSDLTGVIIKTVLMTAVNKGVDLPGDVVNDLKNGLSGLSSVGDVAGSVVAGGTQLISGAGAAAVQGAGEALKGAGKAAGDIGKGAGDAVKGITDIFGGDKNKTKSDDSDKKKDNGGGN